MFSDTRYILRSKQDGQYLVARVPISGQDKLAQYVLVFNENYDALSYLNTHAKDVAHLFSLEGINAVQLKSIIGRWGFNGIGLVNEPIQPNVQFLSYEKGFYDR
ncbi:MAG: hypothetical protein N5P05_000625 [Chroococcopsis gigantea SAG 12.99]|jgi:hypothetical protein|nr:hypothetical protein [Chroococcopsis gigantea SAG 12.99]